MREHVSPQVRLHYSILDGGGAPNIVPDKAGVWYYVRALDRKVVEEVYNRLVKAAQGAAMMTETSLDIEYMGGCYPMVCNEIMAGLLKQTMEEIGQEAWSEDEIKWAKKMNEPVENQRHKLIKRMKLDRIPSFIQELHPCRKGLSMLLQMWEMWLILSRLPWQILPQQALERLDIAGRLLLHPAAP